LRTQPDAPLQLQLGVEGEPGAYAIFKQVDFLPAVKRANRQPRRAFQPGQEDIATVELMPNLPEPYELIDWREKAIAYDRLVFDFDARGEFLPLVWLDNSRIDCDRPTFGLPSYVGSPNQAKGITNSQESITCMGAVLGATLAGIDKSHQEHDYAAMCEAWFNTANAMNLVLNRRRDFPGSSFWYELFPHIVFYGLPRPLRLATPLPRIIRVTYRRLNANSPSRLAQDGWTLGGKPRLARVQDLHANPVKQPTAPREGRGESLNRGDRRRLDLSRRRPLAPFPPPARQTPWPERLTMANKMANDL